MQGLFVLWLVVLISLMGFGITTIPFPLVAEQLGASDFWKTFGGPGVFSLFQFLCAPLWGRLSDAYGRKPILIASMAGSALAYFWLAYADSMTSLIAARALNGVMSGNIAAAFAYATDVTDPKNRARGLGIVTSAFGLGFAIGPFIGGMLGQDAQGHATLVMPSIVSAALSAVALVGCVAFLRESLPVGSRKPFGARPAAAGTAAAAPAAPPSGAPPPGAKPAGRSPFAALKGRPALVSLVVIGLLVAVGGTLMQSCYQFWARDVFGYGPRQIGVHFLWLAGLSASGQLGIIGPLVHRIGERNALLLSVAGCGIGLVLLGFATHPAQLWAGLTIFGLSFGLFTPSLTSLVSFETEPRNRGAVMGAYQAASSGGRIIGPAFSGPMYFSIGHVAPFVASAVLCVAGAMLLLRLPRHRAESAPGT